MSSLRKAFGGKRKGGKTAKKRTLKRTKKGGKTMKKRGGLATKATK
jgi:hypothetical protein